MTLTQKAALTFMLCCTQSLSVYAADDLTRGQVAAAARKATDFFRTQISTEGGYLWQYSEDLAYREGEGKASASMVWVQPPGTPSVGHAYLRAYERTGDAYYLGAVIETANCLVRGQLESGGWGYNIELDPKKRGRYAYRVDGEKAGSHNTTTLDDNVTQAALRFLMRVDEALELKGLENDSIHGAVSYALAHLLEAQYPNGAWPQRFVRPPDPTKHSVKKASYPETWSRTYPKKDYRSYYTFNDNTIADMIATMLDAWQIYDEPKYKTAAEKGGDFIILAQMPEPQPAWAQQYDAEMHPAWARKFEPPSITGGESHGAMNALLMLCRRTGEKKYLAPLPRAIEYFRRSRLPNGQLARFYELKTNKPLYFTKDYKLIYSDADMPTHYAFKTGCGIEGIAKKYEELKAADPAAPKRDKSPKKPKLTDDLVAQAKSVVAALDDRGRWVKDDRLRYHGKDNPARRIIDCRAFVRNLDALTEYLAATRP